MITIKLDASALRNAGCLLQLWRNAVQGYRTKQLYNYIEYGSAYHKFGQTLAESGGNKDLAINEAQKCYLAKAEEPNFFIPTGKEWMNVAHLTLTCLTYLEKFGTENSYGDFDILNVDGKPLVEQTFAIPFYKDEFIEVLLCGTIDAIGKLKQGCYCICDDKTTTQYSQDEYLESYFMDIQLPFYIHAIKFLAVEYPGSIFSEMANHRIGARINGVFLSKTKQTEFKCSRVFFFNDHVIRSLTIWLQRLCAKLSKLVEQEDEPLPEGIFTGNCSGKFNKGCDYLGVCKAPDENARQMILGNSFTKRPYDPLMHRK